MRGLQDPLWQLVASQYRCIEGSDLQPHIAAALASPAVRLQQSLVEPLGLRIDPIPILWKKLPRSRLRLFFQVIGNRTAVEDGLIVALVLLHDLYVGQTLYAHTVHAGPRPNPLLKHVYGPMAEPKAQSGINGDRATLRLLEHKEAIWARFLQEREEVGAEEAGRRWRDRYFWALVRLYHCSRCSACRWGTPQYEGPPGEPYRPETRTPIQAQLIGDAAAPLFLEAARRSEAWRIESGYARRGGFEVSPEPRITTRFGDDHVAVVFPTDAEFLEAGSLVGLVIYLRESTRQVCLAQSLCAGPEPELLFVRSKQAFGLSAPQSGATGQAAAEKYARWRREAWLRFWLCELEEGLYEASRRWLDEFWRQLAILFGVSPSDDRRGAARSGAISVCGEGDREL